MPSQLAFSEHKIYREGNKLDAPDLQKLSAGQPNLQNLPTFLNQPVTLGFPQGLPSPDFSQGLDQFLPLPGLPSFDNSGPNFSQQIFNQVVSPQGLPPDFYQQINLLGEPLLSNDEPLKVTLPPNSRDNQRQTLSTDNGNAQNNGSKILDEKHIGFFEQQRFNAQVFHKIFHSY